MSDQGSRKTAWPNAIQFVHDANGLRFGPAITVAAACAFFLQPLIPYADLELLNTGLLILLIGLVFWGMASARPNWLLVGLASTWLLIAIILFFCVFDRALKIANHQRQTCRQLQHLMFGSGPAAERATDIFQAAGCSLHQ